MGLHVLDHPLVRHKLGLLRKDATSTSEFRALAREISCALAYEASRNLATEKKTVRGWAGATEVDYLSGKAVTVVPVLRGGLGMLDGVLDMIPGAKVGMLGLSSDTAGGRPSEFFRSLARHLPQRTAFVLDPMLATGATVIAAVETLKKEGCTDIRTLHLVASPEGAAALERAFPDVESYTAALDLGLDGSGFILPGLGSAADRIFGTR